MSAAIAIERTNTILYCRRWRATTAFYRDTLGLRVTFENDWFVEFALGDASHLSVADADRATITPAHGAGITLSWRVLDLDQARRTLSERGVETGAVHRRWGAEAFHIRDPEGNRIELWADHADLT